MGQRLITRNIVIVGLAIAIIFGVVGYMVGYHHAKSVYYIPEYPSLKEEKQRLEDSIEIYTIEQSELYAKISKLESKKPDIIYLKRKAKKELNEKIMQYKRLDEDDRIVRFHDMVRNLKSMPDSLR